MTAKRKGLVAAMVVSLAGGLACAHAETDAEEVRRPVRSTALVPAAPAAVEAPAPAADLLAAGVPAPEVAAPDQDGKLVRLNELRGKFVVFFFFLQDFNTTCAIEVGRFRDDYEKFKALDAEILGVSSDKVTMQKEFVDKETLPFRLLSDPDDKVARAFGVPVNDVRTRRVTFVIDRQGVIRQVFPRVRVHGHSAEVLATVEGLLGGEKAAAVAKKAEEEEAAKAAAKKAEADAAAKKIADEKAAKEEAKKAKEEAKKAKAEAAAAAKKAKAEAAAAAKQAKADAAKAAKAAKAAPKNATADGKPPEGDKPAEKVTPADKPAADEKPAAAEKPAAEKPAPEKPAPEKPAAEKPAPLDGNKAASKPPAPPADL